MPATTHHDISPAGSTIFHIPVLADACVDWLNIQPEGIYIDGTLGGGGHTERILLRDNTCRVIGLDYDDDAIRFAPLRLQSFGSRLTPVKENFKNMKPILHTLGISRVHGILLDLGVSSFQLDESEKGFSYRLDAPLDMRTDATSALSAAMILATSSERELADVFFHYGEEKHSRRIARAIVARRGQEPIRTTQDLCRVIESVAGGKFFKKTLSRIFQALRIAVNDELDNLRRALDDAWTVLLPGGRIAVITYHSLEDRIVKHTFKPVIGDDYPVIPEPPDPRWKVLTKKPVLPADEEMTHNPRSRSAKLRVAERLG
jgi:16S rRNA (cytosine1402-N4)-methyltransferase